MYGFGEGAAYTSAGTITATGRRWNMIILVLLILPCYSTDSSRFESNKEMVAIRDWLQQNPLYATTPKPACEIVMHHTITLQQHLKTISWKSPSECCTLCMTVTSCLGYKWNLTEGGTCYLTAYIGLLKNEHGSAVGILPQEGQCKIHDNMDADGSGPSVSNIAEPSMCCHLCSVLDDCRGFSWNNYNGGTCWFKEYLHGVSKSYGVASGIVVPKSSSDTLNTCPLQENKDITQGDFLNLPAESKENCCALCMRESKCKAFSWSDYDGGTCWFKACSAPMINRPGTTVGVIAARKDDLLQCSFEEKNTTQENITCITEDNKDIQGNDLFDVEERNKYGCCEVCKEHPGCKAYAWNNLRGGTCWFKSAVSPVIDKPGVIVGFLQPNNIQEIN